MNNLAYGLSCKTEKYFNREDLKIIKNEAGLNAALKAHGLDYNVTAVQHMNARTGMPTKFYDMYRDDTNAILGAGLTARYHPIQNRDGFALIADLAQEKPDGVAFARGMTFDAGRVAVAQIDLGEMEIGEGRNGFKDTVRKRVTWTNSHDGSGAAQVFTSPVRIVCANTLTMAMKGTGKNGKWNDGAGKFTIRHTETAKDRLNEAREIMRVIDGQLVRTEATFTTMAYTKVTNDHIRAILEDLFPTEGKTAERAGKAREEAVNHIKFFIDDADGHRIDPESAWNVYNAITRYNDHVSPVRVHGEDKSDKAQGHAREQSALVGAIGNKNGSALLSIVKNLEIQDDIEKLLSRVETSQAAQLALYAEQPAAVDIFSIGIGE